MLVLSQLPVLDGRPVVRMSIVGAAFVLLAWSTLLFGVLRRRYRYILRGSKGPFEAPLEEDDPIRLYALACELGWPESCPPLDP